MPKRIITISREFCSGGHEVGQKLAQSLNIDFYDTELISLVAKKSGFSENLFEEADEQPTNSFLYSLAMGAPYLSGGFFNQANVLTNDALFSIQAEVIKNIAKKSDCVIVGRCANYILKDMENVTRVYLTASLDFKIARLLKDSNISPKEAESILYKTDKKRAHYYNYYTGLEWNKLENYDIVLSTSKFGIDKCVDILANCIKYN